MKTVGIIAEYNPFHNGHRYHIEQAKKITGADHVIVVMSGDFVQRGIPAVMPKHLGAEAALRCGASAVFELPVFYATGSAELFAEGAVSLLHQLGCVDSICFGGETDNLTSMQILADVLADEPASYKDSLRKLLKSGMNFPQARQKALQEYLGDSFEACLLESPNNILGIEYLKALKKFGSNMIPYVIQRVESDYHDTALRREFSSATAIRNVFFENEDEKTSSLFQKLCLQIPESALQVYETAYHTRYPVAPNDFSLLLKYELMRHPSKELEQFQDMSVYLANRCKREILNYQNFDQYCEHLKTRDLTHTRVTRALLHVLLNIRKKDIESLKIQGYHHYARLLGFRKDCKELLSTIHRNSELPIYTKTADYHNLTIDGKHMIDKEMMASDLYESIITDKYHHPFISELKKQIIKV